ncbi:cell wall-binding repeat-containing protein [Kineococcus aurantiacus]|uniref:Putative cell wall-binding protein n=1 Tax=Kineococcus aurantiacus TaxID=37633 RepID=A0A7Y9J3D1_9ACTN|nr:putative cell wall-binding protein [Kineococcus aurantiacus]
MLSALTMAAPAIAPSAVSSVVSSAAQAAPGFDPLAPGVRIGGADRYETAALIAASGWGAEAGGTVIVANGETNGVDALSASYLAGDRQAPILLTRRDSVPEATAGALRQLRPSKVIVVGSDASVSAATYTQLTAGAAGERIAGEDRYATAAAIASTVADPSPGATVATVFLARGDKVGVAADALAAAPAAYRGHIPILLTTATGLPEASRFALQHLQPASIAVLGDYNSIDAFTISQAAGAASSYQQGRIPPINRFSGPDRSATAAAIADSFVAREAGIGTTAAGFANGTTVDALAAGPAAGRGGFPVLLAPSRDDVGEGTRRYVAEHESTLTTAYVFGDEKSLTDQALTSVRSPGYAAPVS